MKDDAFRALLEAQEHGAEIVRMPTAYEELLGRVPINYLEADWLVSSFVDEARINRFYQVGNGALARSGQAGEPEGRAGLFQESPAFVAGDRTGVVIDLGRLHFAHEFIPTLVEHEFLNALRVRFSPRANTRPPAQSRQGPAARNSTGWVVTERWPVGSLTVTVIV